MYWIDLIVLVDLVDLKFTVWLTCLSDLIDLYLYLQSILYRLSFPINNIDLVEFVDLVDLKFTV